MTNFQKLIGISVLIFLFLFYWFQIRPSQIKSECTDLALKSATNDEGLYKKSTFDSNYQICLHKKGL